MKLKRQTIPIAAVLVALATAPVLAAAKYDKLKGEVVAVEQQTQNQGADRLITVRTRTGEQRQLRLGDGSCQDCVQVGDQIRARVQGETAGQVGRIQSMQVRRNGEALAYSNQAGQLVRTQLRLRDGSGTGRQAHRQSGKGGNGSARGNCGNGGSGGRGGGGG